MTPIEFRWLEKKVEVHDAPGIPRDPPEYTYEPVLQFRTHIDASAHDINLIDPWGPWRDVPTVREEG